MRYIINERQYKLITEEQEILQIPSLDVFGDWKTLQKFLERKGNPLYTIGGDLMFRTNIKSLGNLTSVGGNLDLYGTNIKSLGNLTSVGGDLDLRGTPLSKKYTIEEIRNMVKVGGDIFSI
jgi:hypothetical protein